MTQLRGYGKKNDMKHAVISLMICLNLTGSLGFANAGVLETRGGLSGTTASTAYEGHSISYPQPVDNSPQLRKMIKSHAKQLVTIWFGKRHWKAFEEIVYIESRWDYKAFNKSTNAYGLTQIIGSKRYTFNQPYKQLLKSVQYIAHRYKTPTLALKHLKQKGWQ